jgi:hypothetical protein
MVDIPEPQPERPASAPVQPDQAAIAKEPPRTPVAALAPAVAQPSAPRAVAPQAATPIPTPAKPERRAPRRVAAIPPADAAPAKPRATEAAPINVMRGGRNVRVAQTSDVRAMLPAAPAITVIRGGRLHPALMARHPGPLILRVPN